MSKSEILNLQIKDEEVARASNLNGVPHWEKLTKIQAYFIVFREKLTKIQAYFIVFWFSILPSFTIVNFIENIGIGIFISIITCVLITYFFGKVILLWHEQMRKKHKHLIKLYQQIINFNSLIEGIDALDQAERSCGAKRLENREKVIEALTVIRADLICALRIEKVFRENANFNSSSFTLNLEPLKFLQLSEQASEYGRLFNEAIEIGISVQEEMQLLQNK